jgi:hypothetical protein
VQKRKEKRLSAQSRNPVGPKMMLVVKSDEESKKPKKRGDKKSAKHDALKDELLVIAKKRSVAQPNKKRQSARNGAVGARSGKQPTVSKMSMPSVAPADPAMEKTMKSAAAVGKQDEPPAKPSPAGKTAHPAVAPNYPRQTTMSTPDPKTTRRPLPGHILVPVLGSRITPTHHPLRKKGLLVMPRSQKKTRRQGGARRGGLDGAVGMAMLSPWKTMLNRGDEGRGGRNETVGLDLTGIVTSDVAGRIGGVFLWARGRRRLGVVGGRS